MTEKSSEKYAKRGENKQDAAGPGSAKRIERPQNAKKTLMRVFRSVGRYKVHLIIALVCLLGNAIAGVTGTYMLKPIINEHIVPWIGHQDPDTSGLVQALITMGAVYLFGACCNFAMNRLMVKICNNTLFDIRKQMFTHMESLPLSYFDSHTHGEIMSSYTNDTDTMREMISQSLPQMLNACVTVTAVTIMMIALSWQLFLLVILWIIVMQFVLRKIGGQSSAFFVRQQRMLGITNGYIEEMIEGSKVVKVFNHEPVVKAEFNQINDGLYDAASHANSFANILMPIMGNLSYFFYALIASAGGVLAVYGLTDLGTLGSFLQYTRNFSQPITNASQQLNNVLTALAGAERIFRLIDEPAETDEGNVTLVNVSVAEDGSLAESEKRTGNWAWKVPHDDGAAELVRLCGDVRFHDVTFSYDGENIVLDDVSLYAKPGQKIAFVGSTGAGKTTVTNLINRFYDIREGTITYDGLDIRDIRKDDLRGSLGMVLQDTHLFTGTVADNIRYGKLDATDEEVRRAAKLANADFFISHLPQGYDTVLTADGANLSQGQRQLIAIARAAVADPPVLILDEATSSIDTRTESLIEKGMDSLMQGRTVFVIAHRLSTVRNSNAIMVLEHGRIIERGDHDDLLRQRGRYYQLYTGMFELS